MEKLYYYIERNIKYFSNIFWLISAFSWLLFFITSFYSIINIYDENSGILFTIVKYPLYKWEAQNIIYTGGSIYPLQMHPIFFYIIIIIISIIALFSFSIYLIIIIYKRNISTEDNMLPNIHKYDFIPLLFISFLFLIGESYKYNVSKWERRNIFGLFFDIIGLATTLFIYYNCKINIIPNIEYIYIIKKGAYSSIIFLEWYYFCYIFTNLFNLYMPDEYYFSIIKILGIILPLVFGIGSIIFSLTFRDIIFAFLSLLINLGCATYFFSIDKLYRRQYNETIDGIINIIFSILLFLEIIFLYKKYKKEILK